MTLARMPLTCLSRWPLAADMTWLALAMEAGGGFVEAEEGLLLPDGDEEAVALLWRLPPPPVMEVTDDGRRSLSAPLGAMPRSPKRIQRINQPGHTVVVVNIQITTL